MISKYLILVLLMSISFVIGCTEPAQREEEHAVSILPLLPQAGETVIVYYNQRHRNAHYKSDTVLYATLRTTSNTEGWRDFRLVMKRSLNDSALWEATFVVPDDLTGFGVTIAPPATMMSNETYATPVYTGENPVQGAIPIQISTAKTLREARDLFQKDERLYPDNYDRWCQLWIGKIKSDFNKDSILIEVDSVRNQLRSINNISSNNRVVGWSACACAYGLIGKWDEARAAVLQIKPLCRDVLPFSAATAFELILGAVYSNNDSAGGAGKRLLLQDIVDIAIETQNLFLTGKFLARIDSSNATRDSLYHPLLSMAARHISGERSRAIRYATQFSAVLDGLIWQKRYGEAADAGTQFMSFLNDVDDWPAFGIKQAVDVFPYESVKASTRLRLAKALLALGDIAGAEHELKTLVLDPPAGVLVDGSIYRASVELAAHYVSVKELDSAEKYCAHAGRYEQMESRFRLVRKTLDAIHRHRKHTGVQAVLLADLLVKYSIGGNQTIRYTGVRISTGEGELTIDSTNRTLYFFFVDEQCSICKTVIPPILSALINKGTPLRDVFLLSENNADQVGEAYGQKYIVVPLTADIRKTFSVAAFPTLLVIRRGRCIFRRDGLSEHTLRELMSDL